MATHSSILAWRIPWAEGPGGLQSIGWPRFGLDWSSLACRCLCLPTSGIDLALEWHLPLPHGRWATPKILCWAGRSFPPAGDHCSMPSKLQPESHYLFPQCCLWLGDLFTCRDYHPLETNLCISFFNHASETCILFCQLSELLGGSPLVEKTASQAATMNQDVHKLDF